MPISVSCPQCQRQFVVRDEVAGKSFRCKDCETVVSVPALRPAVPKSTQTEAPAKKRRSVAPEPPADEEWNDDSWQEEQPSELPPVPKRTRRKVVSERNERADDSSVMPIEAMLAMASIAVLGVLNLWVLLSPDDVLWKLIALLRLAVEARVVWGIYQRNGQTGLAATIAAVMMALISAFMFWSLTFDAEVRADLDSRDLRSGQLFSVLQTVAEIGVIVGLNLPRTRRWMAAGRPT